MLLKYSRTNATALPTRAPRNEIFMNALIFSPSRFSSCCTLNRNPYNKNAIVLNVSFLFRRIRNGRKINVQRGTTDHKHKRSVYFPTDTRRPTYWVARYRLVFWSNIDGRRAISVNIKMFRQFDTIPSHCTEHALKTIPSIRFNTVIIIIILFGNNFYIMLKTKVFWATERREVKKWIFQTLNTSDYNPFDRVFKTVSNDTITRPQFETRNRTSTE